MIVSDDLSYSEVYAALSSAEVRLARAINPTILTWAEWQERREADNHFLDSGTSQPTLFILRSEDDLV